MAASSTTGGLDFEASQPIVTADEVVLDVCMDQRGCRVDLRDRAGKLLRRWTGREVSRAAESGELDVSRPERLRESAWRAWQDGRPKPAEPRVYRLDVRDATVEQAVERVALLLDWLRGHVGEDLSVEHVEPHGDASAAETVEPGSPVNGRDQPAELRSPRSGIR